MQARYKHNTHIIQEHHLEGHLFGPMKSTKSWQVSNFKISIFLFVSFWAFFITLYIIFFTKKCCWLKLCRFSTVNLIFNIFSLTKFASKTFFLPRFINISAICTKKYYWYVLMRSCQVITAIIEKLINSARVIKILHDRASCINFCFTVEARS